MQRSCTYEISSPKSPSPKSQTPSTQIVPTVCTLNHTWTWLKHELLEFSIPVTYPGIHSPRKSPAFGSLWVVIAQGFYSTHSWRVKNPPRDDKFTPVPGSSNATLSSGFWPMLLWIHDPWCTKGYTGVIPAQSFPYPPLPQVEQPRSRFLALAHHLSLFILYPGLDFQVTRNNLLRNSPVSKDLCFGTSIPACRIVVMLSGQPLHRMTSTK